MKSIVTKEKNGEIELLRFIFSLIVVVFHFNATYQFGFFSNGAFGVEFFFIVSGFFMAKSIDRHTLKNSITIETWSFLKKKVLVFFRYYIGAILFQLLIRRIIIEGWGVKTLLKNLITAIPSYFLLTMGNLRADSGAELGGAWYLSAMILAMLILCPLLFYKYEFMSKIACPLLAVFGSGYLYITARRIISIYEWNGLFYSGLLRSISELAWGITCYEVSKINIKIPFTMLSKVLLTFIKLICYAGVFFFTYSNLGLNYQVYVLIVLVLAVILTTSGCTLLIPPSSFILWLGRISLPIYLLHSVIKSISVAFFGDAPTKGIVFYTLIASIIGSVVFMYTVDYIVKFSKKFKKYFIQELVK